MPSLERNLASPVLRDPSDQQQLHQLLTDSTERLRYRLMIEEAIAEASRVLIGSEGQDLDTVLRLIGQAVQADRAYLFRKRDEGLTYDNTHEWCGTDVTPAIHRSQGLDAADFPWWAEQLGNRTNLIVSDVAQLPAAAAIEQAFLEVVGVRSLLVVPICYSDGLLVGFMGFDDAHGPREWSLDDSRLLRVIAEMIGTLWERASVEAASRVRDRRLRALIQQLNGVPTATEAARLVLDTADELLGWDAAWLVLCDLEHGQLEPLLQYDEIDGCRVEIEASPSPLREGGMTWRSIHEGAFLLNRTAEELATPIIGTPPFGNLGRRSASILCVPVRDGAVQVGTLSLQSYRINAYSHDDLDTLLTLGEYCAGTLKRCRAEDARRESEEALRFAMTAARLGVWDRDLQNGTTTWTDYGQVLPGGEPFRTTLATEGFFASIHPEDRDRLEEASQQAIRESSEVAVEFRIIRPDQGERWVGSRGRPLPGPDGEPRRLIGIGEDITERKRLELTLRDQQGLLDAVLENLTEGVLAFDLDGTMTYCNRAAREQYGVDRLPMSFSQWTEQFHCLHADGVTPLRPEEMPLAYAVQGQVLRDVEVVVELPTGDKRRILTSVHPMGNGREQVGVVATLRDVTASRELEEQLRQSQKMEAIGRLAGGVAHDFNNMLAVVNGYTELVLMGSDVSAESRAYLEEVRKAGERAAGLTRQLLAFSRKDVIAPKVLDLAAAVTGMERMLRRLIGEDVELVTDTRVHPLVMADPGHVEQVLLNLAVNARDAMPDGGRLTIHTDEIILDSRFAELHPGVSAGRYALLSVRDTGHGMDSATQKRVFEPFFTTKPIGTGTGLGLSTVYAIVRQWHGQILLKSAPEQGATFEIYLPIAEEEGPEDLSGASREITIGREAILLVEDDEMVRKLTHHVLEAAGYRVLDASGPVEALRIVQEWQEELHLVLTDVVMPQMNGRELVQRLTARRPGLRVLYMSGYTDDAVVRHGVLAAEVELIQKPFSPAELTRRVRELLEPARVIWDRP